MRGGEQNVIMPGETFIKYLSFLHLFLDTYFLMLFVISDLLIKKGGD